MHVTTCYPFNYSNSHTREASDITYASPQVHFKGSNSRRQKQLNELLYVTARNSVCSNCAMQIVNATDRTRDAKKLTLITMRHVKSVMHEACLESVTHVWPSSHDTHTHTRTPRSSAVINWLGFNRTF